MLSAEDSSLALVALRDEPEALTRRPLNGVVAAAWRQIIAAPVVTASAVGRFVSDVAWLLWQKSAALLPRPLPPDEEQEAPPLDLTALWEEMAVLRQGAVWLGRREAANLRTFARPAALLQQPPVRADLTLAGLTLDMLEEAYRQMLARQQPPTVPVARESFPLRSMLEQLRGALRNQRSLSLRTLLARCDSRREQVAYFLALLELARRGEVTARQDRLWGDIKLQRR